MANSSKKHIHYWPHTTNSNIASFRIRCKIIAKELKAQGCIVTYGFSLPRSLNTLILSKRYNRKTLEQALKLKQQTGCEILLDICDNHFMYDEKSINRVDNVVQLKEAISQVDGIIASSIYLKQIIQDECGKDTSVTIIGDYVEQPHYVGGFISVLNIRQRLQLARINSFFQKKSNSLHHRIIWFGNHAGSYHEAGMGDLLKVKNIIERLAEHFPITLTVVSNSREKFNELIQDWNMPTLYIEWNADLFSSILKLHGISIIPISKNPFTMAKTANRVTTSLVHGLQVIADEIPSYFPFGHSIFLENWDENLQICLKGGCKNNSFNYESHNAEILNQWKHCLGI